MHVRQPEISALRTVDKLRVVNSHQVKDRGVKVVHMHAVVDDRKP